MCSFMPARRGSSGASACTLAVRFIISLNSSPAEAATAAAAITSGDVISLKDEVEVEDESQDNGLCGGSDDLLLDDADGTA